MCRIYFIIHLPGLSFLLLLVFLCVQSPYGTRRPSTRSPPTSTSRPCRPSWPLTSPSTSRAALLQGSSWRTWASRTSSGWSSPVSHHPRCNQGRRMHDRERVPAREHARELPGGFLLFVLLSGNSSCSAVDSLISPRSRHAVRPSQRDVILMTHSTMMSRCDRRH